MICLDVVLVGAVDPFERERCCDEILNTGWCSKWFVPPEKFHFFDLIFYGTGGGAEDSERCTPVL